MSGSVALIVMVIGIVLAVVIGNKCKVNIGILCLGWAYIVGCLILGNRVSTVVGLFPIKIFFMVFSVTYFFGFHTNNGTFEVLAKKLMYPCRNHPWALPIMLAVTSAIISALGGGASTAVVVVGPIAYLIGAAAGFNPLLTAIIVSDCAMIGGTAPWTAVCGLLRGLSAGFYGEEIADRIVMNLWGGNALGSIIIFAIAYFVFGGFKTKKVTMEKPGSFNAEQKKSMTMIIIFLVLIIVPMICKNLFGGTVFTWLANNLDIQMVAIVCGIVCSFMKLGDEREILSKRVPWGMILMCGGIATFISVCSNAGAIEVLSSWITQNLPTWFVTPLLSIVGAVLSFVSDTIVVGMNTFGGVFSELTASTGIPLLVLVQAFQLGGAFSSISPFSLGGSLTLSMQPDDGVRAKQFTGQIIIAVAQTIFMVILCSLGFAQLFV